MEDESGNVKERLVEANEFISALKVREGALHQEAKEVDTVQTEDEGSLRGEPSDIRASSAPTNGVTSAETNYHAVISAPLRSPCSCSYQRVLGTFALMGEQTCDARRLDGLVCARSAFSSGRLCIEHYFKNKRSVIEVTSRNVALEGAKCKLASTFNKTHDVLAKRLAARQFIRSLEEMAKISCEHQAIFMCQRTLYIHRHL